MSLAWEIAYSLCHSRGPKQGQLGEIEKLMTRRDVEGFTNRQMLDHIVLQSICCMRHVLCKTSVLSSVAGGAEILVEHVVDVSWAVGAFVSQGTKVSMISLVRIW